MRVAELIRSRIESGELPPGAKVSHTAYAAEFGVSVETVKRACDRLTEDGLLLHGHGHRVPDRPAGNRWFFLSVDRPEEVAGALREAMTDEQVAALMAALVAASWRRNPIVTGPPTE